MKRCMYCGTENDDSSQNCSKCGNRLLDIQPEQVMPAREVPEEEEPVLEETKEEAQDTESPADEPEQAQTENGAGAAPEESGEQEPSEPEPEQPAMEEEIPAEEETAENPDYPRAQEDVNDVQRGQPYAARQQYEGNGPMLHGAPGEGPGNEYYEQQPNVQQQYGGQAYGYQQGPRQYGYPGDTMGGYDYGKSAQPMGGSRTVMIKARKMVKSPLFFLAVLLFTAAVAISVVNLVTGNFIHSINAMQALMQTVMGSSVAVSFLNGIIDILEGMNGMILLAAGLVLNIPGILMCLGLWLMFAQTKRSEGEVSTSGCTLVKVMVVLQFIAVCLVMTAGLIISVAFVVAAGASSSLTSIIVGVVMLLVMILISTLAILFYVQLLFGIKVIRHNVKSGAVPGRIPVFVLFAGVVLCLGTVAAMLPMAPDDYIGLAEKGASAAWMLFFSIWMIAYRIRVK